MRESRAESTGDGGGDRVPRELRPWVGGGDTGGVRLRLRPSGWAVILESLRSFAGIVLLAALVAIPIAAWGRWGVYGGDLVMALAVAAGARLAWQGVVVACRRYVVTDQYVLRVAGVFSRGAASLPIGRIQHVLLHRSLLERLTGTGTLGFATAGTGGIEVAWVTVARPLERLGQVRRVIEGVRMGGVGRVPEDSGLGEAVPLAGGRGVEPVVIGMAGGIGSGKSEVARAFAEAGCVVADSDKAAREALDRPDVREQLVAWWGAQIVGQDGRVDRRQVAAVVFSDPAELRRLEGLVHPIVRQGRAELVAAARAAGAPGVVIDAPLLFEAGLDQECDAVVFVEAPLAVRQGRVRETRGWDAAELARREKVQLPLDEKRKRSDYEVVNIADADRLRSEARRILDQILALRRGNGSGNPGPCAG